MSDTNDTKKNLPENSKNGRENPAGGIPVGDNIYMDPVHYYSREHRLSRASPAVQSLNNGTTIRPGLSKSLFASRAHVLVLVTIILLCAMFGMASRIAGREGGLKLGGNTVALVLLREGELLTLGIIKNLPKSGEAYTGTVDIAVSPVMPRPKEGEPPQIPEVFTHRIFFMPSETETYHIVLPFEGNDFFVILKTEDEQKSMRVRAGEAEGKP